MFPVTASLAGSGRRGFVDGARLAGAYLDGPTEVACLWERLYVFVDSRNNCLRTLDLQQGLVRTLPAQTFLNPRSPVVIDGGAAVLCSDSGHNKVRMLQLARGEGGGVAGVKDCAIAGTGRAGHVDGPAESACFSSPTGLAVLPDGSIVVADTGSHAIRRIAARPGQGGLHVTTLAGGGREGGFADGDGRSGARLHSPTALAVCAATGVIFVCDTLNHAIRALHPPAEGWEGSSGWVLTTLAGDGTPGCTSTPSAGLRLREPAALALTQDGLLLVADSGNHCIRVLCPSSSGSSSSSSSSSSDSSGSSGAGPAEPLVWGQGGALLLTLNSATGRAEAVGQGDGPSLALLHSAAGRCAVLHPEAAKAVRGSSSSGAASLVKSAAALKRSASSSSMSSSSSSSGISSEGAEFAASPAGSAFLASLPWRCNLPVAVTHPTLYRPSPAATTPGTPATAAQAQEPPPQVALHRAPAAIIALHARYSALLTVAGAPSSAQRYADGLSCSEARFRRPSGLCLLPPPAAHGSVLVADTGNCMLRLLCSAEDLAYALTASPASPSLLGCLLPPLLLSRGLEALAQQAPEVPLTAAAAAGGGGGGGAATSPQRSASPTAAQASPLSSTSGPHSRMASPTFSTAADPSSSSASTSEPAAAAAAAAAAALGPGYAAPTAASLRGAGVSATGLGSPPSLAERAHLEASFGAQQRGAEGEGREAAFLRDLLSARGSAGLSPKQLHHHHHHHQHVHQHLLQQQQQHGASSSTTLRGRDGPQRQSSQVDPMAASLLVAAGLTSPTSRRAAAAAAAAGAGGAGGGAGASASAGLLESNTATLLQASTRLIRQYQQQCATASPSQRQARSRQDTALVGVVIGGGGSIAGRALSERPPHWCPGTASRDAEAAESSDTAVGLVRALLLRQGGRAGGQHQGAGSSSSSSSSSSSEPSAPPTGSPAVVLAALTAQSSAEAAAATTSAPPALVNARFAQHTSSSIAYQRARGKLVLRATPAFVNVSAVLGRKMEEVGRTLGASGSGSGSGSRSSSSSSASGGQQQQQQQQQRAAVQGRHAAPPPLPPGSASQAAAQSASAFSASAPAAHSSSRGIAIQLSSSSSSRGSGLVEGTGKYPAPPHLPSLGSSPQSLLHQLAYGDISNLDVEWGKAGPSASATSRWGSV